MAIIDLITTYPKTAIILFSLAVSLAITIVNKFMINQEKMKEIKAKQKALQEEMKKNKDNPAKMMEIQKELMSHMGASMKHSFKPMLITFIPLLLLFGWLRGIFSPVLSSWIWYYIIASIASSLIFRKLFKLE